VVRGLLNQFTYEIPLNCKERITIIHGPNGYGKTTLLRLIDSFYRADYDDVRFIPFESLELQFIEGVRLVITKLIDSENGDDSEPRQPRIQCELLSGTRLLHRDLIKGGQRLRSPEAVEYIRRNLPFLVPLGPDLWRERGSDYAMNTIELFERYPEIRQRAHRLLRAPTEPDWLKEHKQQFRLRFIQSQRLLTQADAPRLGFPNSSESSTYQHTVETYARDLSRTINRKIAEYGALTAARERTFPSRFVVQDDTLHSAQQSATLRSTIENRLALIEEKRAKLQRVGLLDPQAESSLPVSPNFSDAKLVFLDLYTRDVESKLTIFDDLAARIGLFKDLINDRFSFKKLSISKERGFVIDIEGGGQGAGHLQPKALSSGEQHELVLCFELLFKTETDYFVMIDEPEISLHVEWQETFLADLQKIADLAKFDTLIATHSPIIVGNKYDLMVSLSEQLDPAAV
jgi:predicted ATP-binding protein involved in virulence